VRDHPSATTALALGLVAVIGAFFTVGLTLLVAPFAWAAGVRGRRAIDGEPGSWTGRDKATAGMVLGIIGTVLLVIEVLLVALLVVVLVRAVDHLPPVPTTPSPHASPSVGHVGA
jgi:hypothetical protein